MPADPHCPYCRGSGEVAGAVDDVRFVFDCICSGGSEECVRWLLGSNTKPPLAMTGGPPNRPPRTNPEAAVALKAPFRLPDAFLLRFGYRGRRRFVALCWEPCGDEECYHDGVSSACGCCDNWLFLDFIRQPQVRLWLDENGLNIGNSEVAAQHWLVADAQTGDLYAAPGREAHRIVRQQRLE